MENGTTDADVTHWIKLDGLNGKLLPECYGIEGYLSKWKQVLLNGSKTSNVTLQLMLGLWGPRWVYNRKLHVKDKTRKVGSGLRWFHHVGMSNVDF